MEMNIYKKLIALTDLQHEKQPDAYRTLRQVRANYSKRLTYRLQFCLKRVEKEKPASFSLPKGDREYVLCLLFYSGH